MLVIILPPYLSKVYHVAQLAGSDVLVCIWGLGADAGAPGAINTEMREKCRLRERSPLGTSKARGDRPPPSEATGEGINQQLDVNS
jgi:hypothetical protein